MRKYEVKLTEEAKQDRKSLARFIKEEVHAPLTAKRLKTYPGDLE